MNTRVFCRFSLSFWVLLVMISVAQCSDALAEDWTHTWGGSLSDSANSIAIDSAGNFYLAGNTQSFGAGGTDVFLLKYDSSGNLVWARTWGGAGEDNGNAVAVDSSGNVYIAGGTSSFGTGSYDAFLLKFDSSGNLLWNRTWGGGSFDQAYSVALDPAGNVYVAAESYSFGAAAVLLKFSSNGDLLAARTWKGPASYDAAYSLDVDAGGKVILAVTSWYYGSSSLHLTIVLLKYDNAANLLWSRELSSPWPSQDLASGAKVIRTDGAGNIYVAGSRANSCLGTNFSTCDFDASLFKVDPNGNLIWETSWGGPGNDNTTGLTFDNSGNVLVSGMTRSFPGPSSSAFLLKYGASAGNLLSSKDWSASGDISGSSIAVGQTGNILMAGYAPNNSGSWQDVTGTTWTAPESLSSVSGNVGTPTGVLGSPAGTTTSPVGIVDTGGGGTDAFVAKVSSGGGAPLPGMGNDPTTAPAFASEPVNTSNGNYFYQHADFTIPGRGIPLAFQRSYNALDNYAGPLGANWTHSYNITLTQTSTGAVIKWGDGHGEAYTLSGGNYIPQPGVFSTLIQNPDNTFVLTQKNQSRYLFSAAGILTSIVDKNGNTIALTYNGGNLTQITDTVSRNLSLSYDGNRIIQVADPIGRTVSFSYSASDDLAQVTDPAAGVTQFAYDASHHVTSITLPNSQMLLQNTYDGVGRVVSQTNGRGFITTFAYDTPSPAQTTITDARGKNTVHTYDASLRITTITDALGGVVSYSYDANNDRTSVTNQNGKMTGFTYDASGNLTSVTDPLVNTSAFTYDAKNNLLTAANPKGRTTTFSYDANGNLRTIQDALGNSTTFAYDGSGQLSSKTDARGHVTTYGYDSFGNLNQIADALADITTLGYDGIGRLTSLTDPNHHTATAAYDSLSRLSTVTDPLGHQTKFMYDAVGNLQKITDANGHVTSYAYDAVNNLVTVTDALGHVTQYAYDPNNNRATFTNAKGNATSYAYDHLNRLGGVTDPLSFVTTYAYDLVGNVTTVKDANGKTNHFAYDALNRLVGISYADGKNVTYAYDADGNRTTMVDSHGTTAYSYDALDRLSNVAFPGGKTVAYGHDAVGNRNSLTYPDGKLVNYTYDAVNRLAGVSDWLGRMTTYNYDAASNLLAIAYPNKTSMAFAYDAANRLTSLANTMPGLPALVIGYTLDAAGNRTKESVNGVATAFGYDPLSELVSAQLGPLKATWTYDAVGNRLKQTLPLGATTYAYDAGDRLLTAGLAKFTYDNNGNQITKTSGKLTWTNTYDAANRLVKALGYGMNSTFGYDGDGNRVSQTNGPGSYSYLNDVATALPVVLNEQGPDGNITYAYGLGLIEEFSPTFNYFYHYDGLGSVIALTDATGKPRAAYAYDPWGSALLTVTDAVGTKNKFRFTGEALDPGTGLYYLRARYYDASFGRFLSRDPLPGSVDYPATIQRYLYALNNPMLLSDRLGLSPLESAHLTSAIDTGSYLVEAAKQLGEGIVQDLVRPIGVELSLLGAPITPTTVGKISAYTPLIGPVLSIVRSTQDAINHPERGFLENLQRGSIDFAVNTTLTLAGVLSTAVGCVPCGVSFFGASVSYDVNREQIQNNILDRAGGWLSNLFAVNPAY